MFDFLRNGYLVIIFLPLLATFIAVLATMVTPLKFSSKWQKAILNSATAVVIGSGGAGALLVMHDQAELEGIESSLNTKAPLWEGE